MPKKQIPAALAAGLSKIDEAVKAERQRFNDVLETLEQRVVERTAALQEANEQLQMQSEELRVANEELQDQSEELRAANEELQAQQEELQAQAEELRTREESLRESEQRYRSLFENMLDGYAYCQMLFDGQGRPTDFVYRNVNDAFTKLTGLENVVGKRATEVIPTIRASHPELLETYGRVAMTGRPERFEIEFKPLGMWLSISVYSPREGYFTAVFDNITEQKRMEETLRELNATLESKVAQRTAELEHRAKQLQKLTLEASQTEDRERKRMAEILHDDLQQIIAGAKFHLSLLRNRIKHDTSVETIGAKIDEMLKEAIEKSRGLSHELSPAVLHDGDLTETLGWLAKQVRAKHGLVVHVRTPGPVLVRSDALKGFLYKAAQELLFNVVKHARVNEAGIRVRRHGPYICLAISDRGRGFDPQGLRQAAGFGLLSIRERIELLGGRMKIKSAKGKGSRFCIVVPDGTKEGEKAGTGEGQKVPLSDRLPLSPSDLRGRRLRVLLADDHRIVREGLRELLRDEHDIEIVGEAMHGREAVDLALRLDPDVIIMDVSMPLIDGDIATRQIKGHRPRTRIVALSTYNDPETIQKMYRAGAAGYVLKTAPVEELLAAIRGRSPNES